MRSMQAIHTDLGGYFTFTLGTSGPQGNMDFSASNEGSMMSRSMDDMSRNYRDSLTGCELRITLPGYHPLTHTITQHTDMGRVDIGTLRLNRLGNVKGSAISVTSLLVPKNAEKEFEKGLKELQKNRPDRAQPFFTKAIALYDKYAAAWNELGRTYIAANENEKAVQAFEKAIAADSDYIPPYVNLATLQAQAQQWERSIETAGKVLELDPSIGFARFLEAVGHYNLNHMEDAEKSAREAVKVPDLNLPQVHALLAEIFLRKEAYSDAAAQMRAYLQQSPQGQYAEQMRQSLEQIGEQIGKGTGDPAGDSSQPATASRQEIAEPEEPLVESSEPQLQPLEPLQTKP
ncbi:MAG: tetratricopeptide repeat protein [Acidobacteria bacterium]|nr:tetratricopeptide repeat protein [Acidobacteriota bacterium]